MRRSGVRIPLAPPQADIRSGCRFFVCSGAVLWWRVVVLLVAPLVFRALRCDALWGPAAVCAGGRRPAREIATREPAARSGRSRGPPWPCRHPPALRPGPAADHGHRSRAPPPTMGTAAGPRHRPRAPQPGPATTHGHRSRAPPPAHRYGRALRSLRHPPHRRLSRNSRLSLLLAAPLVFRAPSGPAAREIATREPAARKCRSRSPPVPSGPSGALHTSGAWSLMCCSARWLEARLGPRCPRAPRPATHVKPSSPLLACALPPVKPTTPLQARYTCFWCNFGEQRRRGFHGDVPMSPHWCRRFHLAAR